MAVDSPQPWLLEGSYHNHSVNQQNSPPSFASGPLSPSPPPANAPPRFPQWDLRPRDLYTGFPFCSQGPTAFGFAQTVEDKEMRKTRSRRPTATRTPIQIPRGLPREAKSPDGAAKENTVPGAGARCKEPSHAARLLSISSNPTTIPKLKLLT